jgi:N-acetylmuramoyl-L-alanine amidase
MIAVALGWEAGDVSTFFRPRTGILLGLVALLFLTASCSSGNSSGTASTVAGTRTSSSAVAASTRTVIAWNPSHQDDNGTNGWHEYAVCGDIAKRTMALLSGFKNVLCWETGMGLTSKNDASLKAEAAKANAANAQVFIAVHVNGGAGSGFTGEYSPGDSTSARYAEALLKSVAATMNMKFYYVRPRTGLLVLDPANNQAPIRVLLELGDNVADRALLLSKDGRQRLAAALAKAINENTPSTFRYEQGDARLEYRGTWTVGSDTSASGGSFRYTDVSGASLTATFNGTHIAWIAKTSPAYGKAKVTVDGGGPVIVDLYSETAQHDQKVWETAALASGVHTVKIAWTGTKNAAASGTSIDLDAVDVTGALTSNGS